MNTSSAAIQAHVTADTIRAWCRRGVIAAVKTAGRWAIDATSLAHRIAIDAMKRRTRKETAPVIDLTASYTFTHAGAHEDATVTPVIKRRTTPYGGNTITVSSLIPLFADRFDAIPDDGDRVHALTVFSSARIVIAETPDPDWDDDPQARDHGRLRTTYRGGAAGISITDVLDLAEKLRTQLSA